MQRNISAAEIGCSFKVTFLGCIAAILRSGCNKRRASLDQTGTVHLLEQILKEVDSGLSTVRQPRASLSYCCSLASMKPTCKPWSEPWSEASVVVLPRWSVALVWTSLVLVTLTSLRENTQSPAGTVFSVSTIMANKLKYIFLCGAQSSVVMNLASLPFTDEAD